MKNRIRIITVLALIFVASYSLRALRYGSYSIDRLEREVYYEGMYVRGADASTFEDLGYGYGKDRRHVYRYGEVLEYVDPSSFRVSREFASSYSPDGMRPGHGGYGCGNDYRRYDNGGYYKDNFHVFFRGREIDGAHVTGFEILEDGYAKDSFNVYWNGREISDAKPMSFECLGWGYAKDTFSVYWNGEKIEAKVLSFKVSRDGYAEDAFNTYYRGRKIRK